MGSTLVGSKFDSGSYGVTRIGFCSGVGDIVDMLQPGTFHPDRQ